MATVAELADNLPVHLLALSLQLAQEKGACARLHVEGVEMDRLFLPLSAPSQVTPGSCRRAVAQLTAAEDSVHLRQRKLGQWIPVLHEKHRRVTLTGSIQAACHQV